MKTNLNLQSPESGSVGLPSSQIFETFALPKTEGKWARLMRAGHFPTLVSAFLYFDYSFMVWTLLGVLGAQIAEALSLSAQQKFFMVSVPILAGGLLRLVLGLLVDRIGAKTTGIIAQLVVIIGLAAAWQFGLKDFSAAL